MTAIYIMHEARMEGYGNISLTRLWPKASPNGVTSAPQYFFTGACTAGSDKTPLSSTDGVHVFGLKAALRLLHPLLLLLMSMVPVVHDVESSGLQ